MNLTKIKRMFCFTLSCLLLAGIGHASDYTVEYAGALKNFMHKGDTSAKFDLQQLEGKKGLYALGAMENLKGEIQIFDGIPYNSIVSDGKLEFDTTFNKKAALLVYAQVPKWQESVIPPEVTSYQQLEKQIAKAAAAGGIDIEQPFPFLLSGNMASVAWHVIDWDPADKKHTHRKHIESGLNGTLENVDATILGFYSRKHTAIFTHHSTHMHMHIKTDDHKIAGHVDKLTPGRNMRLKLPKRE